jgi:hypothetical protein
MTVRPRPAAGAALAVLALGACASPGSLRADRRVRITSPAPMAPVTVPFTVKWDADPGVGNRFAVFVDRAPLARGADIAGLADPTCRSHPPCPDDAYFRRQGVYVVTADEATIATLPAASGLAAQAPHPVRTLSVVALDDSGRRTSDTAWEVEIRG